MNPRSTAVFMARSTLLGCPYGVSHVDLYSLAGDDETKDPGGNPRLAEATKGK
jgi:hypothetical protein